MSDIAPLRAAVALGATATAGTASTAPPLTATANGAIPAALAQLGIGAVINGVVAERGLRGQIVIRTDKGSLNLQSALPMRVGAAVTMQIQSLGAQSQLTILSVDGQAPAGQQAGPATKQPPPPAAPGPAASPVKALPAAEPALKAASSGLPSALPPTLRTGALLTGLVLPQTPGPNSLPVPSAPPAPPSGLRREGEPIAVRILGVTPPSSRPAAAPTPTAIPPRAALELTAADDAVTFTATIVDSGPNEASGSTLLRSPFGLIRLPVPAHEPPGSQVALELLPSRDGAPARALNGHELGTSRQILALGQQWPALRNLVTALETEAPELAQQTLTTALPRVGPTLAAGMLLFVAAMRNGNLRHWLGEQAVETLERRGHGGLVKQLADDMAALPRLTESQPNGWQTLLLPVYDGEALRQIRMSLRRSRKDEAGERKDGARFIIEAELSKLGPLQLDGLVRMPQFDLAVRTRENMPPDLRANIVEIFNDALQATGMRGSVAFQATRDLRPGPFDNWQASGHGMTV
jgi:hypothetical protein